MDHRAPHRLGAALRPAGSDPGRITRPWEHTMTELTERSVTHATFVIERTYDASPARVFTAFADPAIKVRWFGGDAMQANNYSLDFRVGGHEISRGAVPAGAVFLYDALFQDIVPDQRIVITYDMHMDDVRIS